MNRVTRVKCIVPFVLFMINSRGYCYSCCSVWTKIGNVGKLTQDNSIMDIWNNERMQFMRKVILEDSLEKLCNFQYCPYANKKEYFDLEAMKNDDPYFNHIMDQIMEGRTIMDGPPHTIQVANSGKCNLKCIMCQTNDKCQKSDDVFDEKLFTQIIPEVLPKISRLYLTLKGEVFFNPNSRKFLQTLDPSLYPLLKINLYTNGTMFTPALWETVRHNHYDCIYVSIDAASKATYEKIRKNGNWDILRRNLALISELRRKNVFLHFCINFCVMKSNYKEMKDFVKMCLDLGCDRIYFQKIDGYADIRENINFTHNKRVFAKIAEILADPIFSRPEVDVTVFDQYRKYLGKPVFFWDAFITKTSEWVLYYPFKAVFSLAKYFPFMIDIYMFFEKKRIPVENQD